jgi:hypothetical protein
MATPNLSYTPSCSTLIPLCLWLVVFITTPSHRQMFYQNCSVLHKNFYFMTTSSALFYHNYFCFITATSLLSQLLLIYHNYFCFITSTSLLSQLLLFYHNCFCFITTTSLLSQVLLFYHKYFSFITTASVLSQLLLFYHNYF